MGKGWLYFFCTLGFLLSSTATALHNPYEKNSSDETIVLYLEAEGTASSPHLSLKKDASEVEAHQAVTDLTSGSRGSLRTLSDGLVSLGGDEPPTTTFALEEGFPRKHFLNLSARVFGTLYWRSVVSTSDHDAAQLRLELYAGETLIGGTEFTHAPLTNPQTNWMTYAFVFRPEVRLLESGQPLSLKIQQLSGYADLWIGTGGDHQSFIGFHSFPLDPLSGALYVEKNRVTQSSPDTQGSTPKTSEESVANPSSFRWAWGSLTALPFLGLWALRRRPPGTRASLLGVALLVTVALGGCLGGETMPLENGAVLLPAATISLDVHKNETLEKLGIGLIGGQVLRETNGFPVVGAHVFLLGTNRFTETNGQGRFSFHNLTPNAYLVRADITLDGEPLSAEKQVTLEAGDVFELKILLSGDDGMHIHDYWQGETRQLYQTAEALFNVEQRASNQGSGVWYCTGTALCQAPFSIDAQKPILPGTTLVEIVLDWKPSATLPKEMGIRVTTAGDSWYNQYFLPREPGKPFFVPIFPNEADPGHQQYTSWTFSTYKPARSLYHPMGPIAYAGTTADSVKASIWMHKGVVPFEPAHRDFWNGSYEMGLFNVAPLVTYCSIRCNDYPASYPVWTPGKDLFVPPGTKEIQGTIRWQTTADVAIPDKWSIAYKPANVPGSDPQYFPAKIISTKGKMTEFVIEPAPEETDQFYQSYSNWRFYPDDLDQPAKGVTIADQLTFYLTATAIRDPEYEPSKT